MATARLRWRMPDGRAGELPLLGAETTIGRATECGFVVDSALVSRVHCRIVRGDDGWAVEDAGSSNGTFVNGYQIRTRRPLAAGDRIRLGLAPVVLEAELVVDPEPVAEERLAADPARTAPLQQALAEAQEREAAARRAAARAAAEAEQAHAEAAETRELLAGARDAIARLEGALAAARDELAAADAAARQELGALRDALEARRHDLRKLEAERDRFGAALAGERARVAELEAVVAQLRDVLDEDQRRIAALEAVIAAGR